MVYGQTSENIKASAAAADRNENLRLFFFFLILESSIRQQAWPNSLSVNIPFPSTILMAHSDWFLPPQVGGCANRVHEEQGVGQVLSRAPGITQALFASGFLPAQASAEDPQVSPTVARASICP